MLNVGLLVGGFGLGQGSIFVVQTWLIARGEFDILAAFGTHYSFAILGVMLVDGGSLAILARHAARLGLSHGDTDEVWRIFWETSIFRAVVAVASGIAAVTFAIAFTTDDFTRLYVATAIPGLLLWAVNGAGILDGLRLSGVSGLTGSIAYGAMAVGLAIAPGTASGRAGAILGTAFTLGYFLTVVTQWAALARYGHAPRFRAATWTGVAASCRDGVAMLGNLLPGQIYFRFQLMLGSIYLGAEVTALFFYAKQVVGALTQVITFALRVDYPGLVKRLSGSRTLSLHDVFALQKTTIVCAVGFTIATVLLCAIAPALPVQNLGKAAGTLIVFAPAILSISALSMVSQAMAAIGEYAALARVITAGALVGMVTSYLFVATLGIWAFFAGEVVFHAVSFVMIGLHIRALDRTHNDRAVRVS